VRHQYATHSLTGVRSTPHTSVVASCREINYSLLAKTLSSGS